MHIYVCVCVCVCLCVFKLLPQYLSVADNAGDAVLLHVPPANERQK